METTKLLTLTERTTPDPLISRIHRIKHLAKRLAHKTGMHVQGERLLTYVEVCMRDTEKRVCLHILGRWPFIPLKTLRDEWNRLTGTTCMVYVRLVRDEQVEYTKDLLHRAATGQPIRGDE